MKELVPGDIILLVGGVKVPADVRWLKGDKMKIDTAALTGEPLPRTYPSHNHGSDILAGTTVCEGEAYCQVLLTGENTETGRASKDVFEDKSKKIISLFEKRIMTTVYIVIAASFCIVLVEFLIQGVVRNRFNMNRHETYVLIVNSLAILVASIPIALPIVMQVTMALGMKELSKVHRAIVTSVPALQDIACMSILCSDKTGTLTTALITIQTDGIVSSDKFEDEDVLLYAAAAANADKLGDPIDSAILRAREAPHRNGEGWTQDRLVGFSPVTKRTLAFVSKPDGSNVIIAKGILSKILDTAAGGKDDADLQWKVVDSDKVCSDMIAADEKLSRSGYKTIAIAISSDGGKTFHFTGILPMLDPPRSDTKKTIDFLHHANVSVKMITGDHRNIAIETGKLIDLGTNILPANESREDSGDHDEVNERIWDADGFAQVLPSDKRRVVSVLRHEFGCVVGMTGDGVNDAPALSAAQVGIAVEGATDAAKNAAAIILTDAGLSPIFGAIVMSREIFRKVKAYVVYRISASIFIVLTLCMIIFISSCTVDSILIILLAVFNDISMLPIAYDKVSASRGPELPRCKDLIVRAIFFGVLCTGLAMLFVYTLNPMHDGNDRVWRMVRVEDWCSKQTSATIWMFICLLSESMIFSVRVPQGEARNVQWRSLTLVPRSFKTKLTQFFLVHL